MSDYLNVHFATVEHLRQTVEQLYASIAMIKSRERILIIALILLSARTVVSVIANLMCFKLKKRMPKWLDIIL